MFRRSNIYHHVSKQYDGYYEPRSSGSPDILLTRLLQRFSVGLAAEYSSCFISVLKFAVLKFFTRTEQLLVYVDGAYWFWLVHDSARACVTLFDVCYILSCQGFEISYIWIPHGTIADPFFFFPSYLPFWSMPLWKEIRMKSCQQDISKSV